MKSNLNGEQFHQLPMFMSANEIKSNYQSLPGDRKESGPWHDMKVETDEQLYSRKANEAKHRGKGSRSGGPSLYQSIAKEGVKDPIPLSVNPPSENNPWIGHKTRDFTTPEVVGGQHRIAVMGETQPDTLMPVLHHENIVMARHGPWTQAYGRQYS